MRYGVYPFTFWAPSAGSRSLDSVHWLDFLGFRTLAPIVVHTRLSV